MADIFISYAREDVERAQRLAEVFEARGRSVFWDRSIRVGEDYAVRVARELEAAAAVIVLWSPDSVVSNWVIDEAEAAQVRGTLVPVLTAAVTPPLGMRRIHSVDLSGISWRQLAEAPAFAAVARAVDELIGGEVPPLLARPSDHPRRRAAPPDRRRTLVLGGGALAALVVVVLVVLLATGGSGDGDNLLRNPSFSPGGGWRSNYRANSAELAPGAGSGEAGGNSFGILRIESDITEPDALEQDPKASIAQDVGPLRARAGESYTFTVKVRSAGDQPFSGELGLWVLEADGSKDLEQRQPDRLTSFSSNDQWTAHSIEVGLPVDHDGLIRVEIYGLTPGGELLIDDASLVRS